MAKSASTAPMCELCNTRHWNRDQHSFTSQPKETESRSVQRRLAIQKSVTAKVTRVTDEVTIDLPPCGLCGKPYLTLNPHPDAGKPDALLTVGAVYVCIPCNQKALHGWAERALVAEKRLSELEKKPLTPAEKQAAYRQRKKEGQ